MGQVVNDVLLSGNEVTLSELNSFVDLLVVESDAATDLLIGHLKIVINDLTSIAKVNVSLDGTQYLRNFRMLETSLTFDWGRNLRLHGGKKKLLIIEIKKTTAGAGDMIATAYVDGLKVPALKT